MATPPFSPPLSDTSCVVVLITLCQSNGSGTNSILVDAPDREWDIAIPDAFIWDQTKRLTAESHFFQDTDTGPPSRVGQFSQFRPLTVGYGRTSNQYPWEESSPGGVGFTGIAMHMQIAQRLRQFYRRPVYIIQCAKGSTGVTDLGAGNEDWNITGIDTKPESMMELARDYFWGAGLYRLLNDEGYARADIHLAGVVSMLGATDSDGNSNYLTYEADLTASIAATRAWIKPSAPLTVPWVIARSEAYFDSAGDFTNGHTRIAEIRQSQADIVAHVDTGTNIALASCDECDRESGGTGEHFLAQADIILGNEVAAQLTQLTPMASPEGEVDPT